MDKIQAVIFDCDGVIINSAVDIANAVNVTLDHFSYNRIPESIAISFVGNGAKKLIERSVAFSLKTDESKIDSETISKVLAWYKEYYNNHAVERTVLYPGFANLLEYLLLKKIRMSVVSNKPEETTHKILAYFDIDEYFDAVIGPEQLTNIKPNPEGLQKAVQCMEKSLENQISKDSVLMVGDSWVDIRAGHNFGCKTCAITLGLGDKEKLLIEKPDLTLSLAGELCNYLGK